ncbi:DUF350 domain-containing protein [Rapidithrix thailandica]|uniref:DUF350 domain-containing protein n=1 Tax=Rapidithrix thailandica TaxID=413964 RepID=A0AAW9SEK1_9BACT
MESLALLENLASPLSLLVLYVVIFLLAKWIKNFLLPYKLDEELTEKDNLAQGVSLGGYFIGVTAIFVGVVDGPSYGWVYDLVITAAYSLAGIVVLNFSRLINDKFVLRHFSTTKEIVEDKNVGTGVVECASYIASGLVIAGAVHGEGGSWVTALVFYLIGQVALILFSFLYDLVTPYKVHEEIEKDNVAAGLGFAGGLIAIGIIVMRAVSGDFESWAVNLQELVLDIILVFVFLVVVRLVFDKWILLKADLNKEITQDRNLAAGILEFTVAVSFSTVLFFTI